MSESIRQNFDQTLLNRIAIERSIKPIDESKPPAWFEPDFTPKVLRVKELPRVSTVPNEATTAPRIYKVTHSNVYCGESGDLKFNGQTYIITPAGIEVSNQSGKLVFTSNVAVVENIQASIILRGGTGEQSQLLDSTFTQPKYLNEYLATEHNQVVLFPVYPESLPKSDYDKYIKEHPKFSTLSPKQIYKARTCQNDIDFPRVVGLDDLLWKRLACSFSSIRLVSDENIDHICGFSTGGGTALLLLENATKMGLRLTNLRSILAAVPAIDPKNMINYREGLKEFFHSYYDTTSEAALRARTPDILKLVTDYPSVKFYMIQGLDDENLPVQPFIKLMDEAKANKNYYSNLHLRLVPGAGHNLVSTPELYQEWMLALEQI